MVRGECLAHCKEKIHRMWRGCENVVLFEKLTEIFLFASLYAGTFMLKNKPKSVDKN